MRLALTALSALAFIVGVQLGQHDPQVTRVQHVTPLVVDAACGGGYGNSQTK